MRYFISIILALLVLWGFSIVLDGQVQCRTLNREIGFDIPTEGYSVARFTEGGAVSHFGWKGLNPVVLRRWDGSSAHFMLLGDSYVEALQVSDENKPDAVLTRYLGGKAVVLGSGVSGFGFPSMIARAAAYENAIGKPIANIFLCASGIDNDVLSDVSAEKLPPYGYRAICSSDRSQLKIFIQVTLNRLYLNFIPSCMKRLEGVFLSPKDERRNAEGVDQRNDRLRDELEYALNAMKHLDGEPIIVYCPNVPKLKNGVIGMNDNEIVAANRLRKLAKEKNIQFIDVTDALVQYFNEQNRIPRGFANLGGPGNGHLTADGIDAVFKYVAERLVGSYGL